MKSQGRTGEQLAQYKFTALGWRMDRHQPETRMVYVGGKSVIVHTRSTGVPDYTGYELVNDTFGQHPGTFPIFRACEVKEGHAKTLPCSRLGRADDPHSQNYWFSQIDHRCAFVCVVWMEGQIAAEMYKWKPEGSYKQGEGF